jgi:NhaP-type Na+/H+ or K+/H+ antiporter
MTDIALLLIAMAFVFGIMVGAVVGLLATWNVRGKGM